MKKVLDMAVVEELLSLTDDGDPELLLDLIDLFLADGPAKIEAVMAGQLASDFERMERAAHSLKGSSGNLGARSLQETCERLQIAARQHDPDLAGELVPLLEAHFQQAREELENLRRRYRQ